MCWAASVSPSPRMVEKASFGPLYGSIAPIVQAKPVPRNLGLDGPAIFSSVCFSALVRLPAAAAAPELPAVVGPLLLLLPLLPQAANSVPPPAMARPLAE